MGFRAIHKHARISPRKTRLVVDLIRGKSANDALRILKSMTKRAAPLVAKVLNSAIANASQQDANVNELFVSEARVDGGPTLKRFRPGPMGRAMRIRKRSSHIIVAVSERSQETATETAKTN